MSQRTGIGMSAPVPVRVNKAVKHHVYYVEHSQPTNVGIPTKDQNISKETLLKHWKNRFQFVYIIYKAYVIAHVKGPVSNLLNY